MRRPTGAGLVVAVLTYRRLAHITELAPLLVEQAAKALAELPEIGATEVIVIDNDPQASARDALKDVPGIRYVHEPEPGIAAGRNRALDEAAQADLIAFIDDDERPEAGWLSALVRFQRRTGAEAVVGRVERVFTGPVKPWIAAGGYFNSAHLPSGTKMPAAATNNLLLDLHAVRQFGLRFDNQFGLTGGSDTHFTRALKAHGGEILWCDEAVVADQIPAARVTRDWVLRRSFRAGNSDGRVSIALAGSPGRRALARLRSFGRGVARCAIGIVRAGVGKLTKNLKADSTGCRMVARGLGMIAASVGHSYHEYERVEG